MKRQREFAVLDAIGGIDSSLICEAETDILPKRRIKLSKFAAIIAAAALITSALGIGAAAVINHFIPHKENALHEYNGNTELLAELENRTGEPIVCENSHLRMTVDTVISDEIYIRCTATLEGLDNDGKQFISDNLILPEEAGKMTDSEIADYFENVDSDFDQFIPYMIAYSQSGERLTGFNSTSDNMFGKKGNDAEATFTFGINKSNLGNDEKVKVECNQLKTYFKEQNAGIFEGMSFELPLKSNFDTLILQSESGDEIYLSEVCLYENRRAEESEELNFSVYYTDGENKTNILTGFTEDSLYRLGEVKYVKFNGKRYDPEELIKSSR